MTTFIFKIIDRVSGDIIGHLSITEFSEDGAGFLAETLVEITKFKVQLLK